MPHVNRCLYTDKKYPSLLSVLQRIAAFQTILSTKSLTVNPSLLTLKKPV